MPRGPHVCGSPRRPFPFGTVLRGFVVLQAHTVLTRATTMLKPRTRIGRPMAQGELPPQLRDQLNQYQNLQQQLQMVAQQKAQFEMQLKDLEKAKEALGEAADDTEVYRSVGSLLLKTPGKGVVLKDVEEDHETMEVRVKNLSRQQAKLTESLTELQSKIQNGLARMQQGGGSQ